MGVWQTSEDWDLIKYKYLFKSPLRKHVLAIYKIFHSWKNDNFQMKILIFFLFLLKNIDCGYTLEPPR